MKIIEALKKIKDLQRKADDLKKLVKDHCADLDCETPIYPDQKAKVAEWIHCRKDLAKTEQDMWGSLTDRGLKEGSSYQLIPTSPVTMVKRRLYFEAAQRDQMWVV